MKSPFILALAILFCAPAAHAFSIGDADRGRMVFTQRCAMCHGEDGKGRDGMAANLVAEWHRLTKSDRELAVSIRSGLQTPGKIYGAGPMPPQILTDRDMDDVLAYVRLTFGAPQFDTPQFDKPRSGAPQFGAPQFGAPPPNFRR